MIEYPPVRFVRGSVPVTEGSDITRKVTPMDGFSGTNFYARVRRNPRLDEVDLPLTGTSVT